MKYRTRTFYTNKQTSEMWDRWPREQAMSSIGRDFNRAKQAQKPPKELCKSLTWNRGSEMAGYRRFTMATKFDVYFCDPQPPLSSLRAASGGQGLRPPRTGAMTMKGM